MRALVQRVAWARVRARGETAGEIGPGLLVLLGVRQGDGEAELERLAAKVAKLRVFADDAGKMNRSVLEVRGAALVVSQFTLYGDARGGNRPSFARSARPAEAEALYRSFCRRLESLGVPVQTGVFGASMEVELLNQGPVTLLLDSDEI